MKKLLRAVMAFIFLSGCTPETPATFDYYTGFTVPAGVTITAADTEKYKDTTIQENTALLRDELEIENLREHQLFEKKKAVVVNFNFGYSATDKEIEAARKYAFETFWQGKVHTAHMLPYEDWQYSHMIKDLTVQIFNEGNLVLQDVYTFEELTNSGEKKYTVTTAENTDHVFLGTYIYLGDYLKGSEEQLADYTDLQAIAGQVVHTSIRQTLLKDKMYVELMTEEKQIDPQYLNDIYFAVVERYSFINENIYISLFVADNGMYFQYNSPVEIPAAEE